MTSPTTTPISQDEINRAAWAACDSFRGVLDPSQYKDYILVMLFFKYVSDQWAEHEAAWRVKYKGDEVKWTPESGQTWWQFKLHWTSRSWTALPRFLQLVLLTHSQS